MKGIRKYRSEVPDPDIARLWKRIEPGILTDGLYSEINRTALESALVNLPEIIPGRDIWPGLSIHLKENETKIKNRFRIYSIRFAAAIIILTASVLMTRFLRPEIPGREITSLKQQPVGSFLDYVCAKYPKKCTEPEFLELKTEIIRLEDEKTEIENSIFFNPEDASIARVNDRINNQMIQLRDQIIEYVE